MLIIESLFLRNHDVLCSEMVIVLPNVILLQTRGGNREPVPTQNRFLLTNSIRIVRLQCYRSPFNDSLIPLPAQGFTVFLKFCVAVRLRHTLCDDDSDLQPRGSIMERRRRSGCISPKKMSNLTCVISEMLQYCVTC